MQLLGAVHSDAQAVIIDVTFFFLSEIQIISVVLCNLSKNCCDI